MQIDAYVDIGGIGPYVVPDVVGKDVGAAATGGCGLPGEDTVDIGESYA